MTLRKRLILLLVGMIIVALPILGIWYLIHTSPFEPASKGTYENILPTQMTDSRFGLPVEAVQGNILQVAQREKGSYECGWFIHLSIQADVNDAVQRQAEQFQREGYQRQQDVPARFGSHNELIAYLKKHHIATEVSEKLPLRTTFAISQANVQLFSKQDKQNHHAMMLFDPAKHVVVILLSDNKK